MTVRIPYGEKNGELVHVDQVRRGLECNCVCPVCRGALVARKGDTNVHHFAHAQGEGCDGETLFHQLGKRLLYARIFRAISQGEEIPFHWRCRECHDVHQGNLIEMASTVALEESLGSIQPDVTVFDQYGRPRVLVEVVVTHKPEPPVWEYAYQNETHMVVFRIETEYDLVRLDKGTPLVPEGSFIPVCNRTKCNICYKPLRKRFLFKLEKQCESCGYLVQHSFAKTDTPLLEFYGPEGFNSEEIALAEQEGVILQMQHSTYFGFSYLANTCSNCGREVSRLYDYRGIGFQLTGNPPLDEEDFCVYCETRPDNRTRHSQLQGCIMWECDGEPEIGKVVCSSHLQSYLEGSQRVPFMNLS